MDIALGGRTIAEVAEGHSVPAAQGLAVGPADGMKHRACHHGLDGREAASQGIVHSAVPRCLVGGHVRHHVHAHGPGDTHLAVRREGEVAGSVEGVGAADLGGFLAEFRSVAGDDSLALPGNGRGIEVSNGSHQGIELPELSRGQGCGVGCGHDGKR
ncbi:hypothetical protein AHiyo1_07930 [Arthrobacter sp. Hiyo1]|nr:hypothetical protein AHiyo1_07930 [Arthrobacter sp. Hiyo1]